MGRVVLDGDTLTIDDVVRVARHDTEVDLSAASHDAVQASRSFIEQQVDEGNIVYGVTTGFGEMVNHLISAEHAADLQRNLVVSHASNVGPYLPDDAVRATMLIRANCLANGRSGVKPETVTTMLSMLNRHVHPAVPSLGSVGASGDLNPLAHIAAAMIGEGTVRDGDTDIDAETALNNHGIDALTLGVKEGLALINGTSVMTAVSALAIHDCRNLLSAAEITAAMTCEALAATTLPFDADGNAVKNDPGQERSAERLRSLLDGSALVQDHDAVAAQLRDTVADDAVTDTTTHLQDAYSLRATPQVLGTVRDMLETVSGTVEDEMNAVADNPVIFADKEKIFHGANFHGQRVAQAADHLANAACQIGVIADRRIERLLDPKLNGELPAFLVRENAGLRCGFAGAQYVATSLVAENRVLCTPASIQSIPSNGGNQDAVSMGLVAARQAAEVVRNTRYIVAVELLAACDAVELRGEPGEMGAGTRAALETIRDHVPPVTEDRSLTDDIETVAALIADGTIIRRVEDVL